MLDLSAIIARVEDTPRQTADVEVAFNVGLATRLEELRQTRQGHLETIETIAADLEQELADLDKDRRAGDPRPAEARQQADTATAAEQTRLDEIETQIDALEQELSDYLVTFRFTALSEEDWAALTAHSEPRDGHPEDAGRDFNLDEVTRIAATRTGVRVLPDGDTAPVAVEEWAGIWKALHRLELRSIKLTVFTLNEYAGVAAHSEAVVAARKVSAARQAASQPSPSTSASTPAASQGGSRRKSPTTSTTTQAA